MKYVDWAKAIETRQLTSNNNTTFFIIKVVYLVEWKEK